MAEELPQYSIMVRDEQRLEWCKGQSESIVRSGLGSFPGMIRNTGEEGINCFIPGFLWLMLLVQNLRKNFGVAVGYL